MGGGRARGDGRKRRRGRRLATVAMIAAVVGMVRKQKLDAADAAFPEATARG